MNLIPENDIFTTDHRKSIYYSIIKCPDGKIRFYNNQWVGRFKTLMIESNDGVVFDQRLHLVLNRSGASHNFTPFYGKNNKLYAIGGVDNWKFDPAFHGIQNQKDFKRVFENKFRRSSATENFNYKIHRKLISNKPAMPHVNGLYLFESAEGKVWKEVQKEPIITVWNAGYIDAIRNFGKGSEFDGMIGCCWVPEESLYYIYLRANISPGIRYIQYSTSPDLLNWSEFQLVDIEGYDISKDNYYIPSIFRYKGKFVGLVPFFDQKGNSCIRVLVSRHGRVFEIRRELFGEKTQSLDGKPKNACHAVYGLIENKSGVIYIYIHHNNLGLKYDEPVRVQRYTVQEKEFDEVVKC